MISLEGKKGLVVGIANESSIAYGCARKMREAGAELAVTYLNAKAEPHVRPLAESLGSAIFLPLDVRDDRQLRRVFDAIQERWGKLDFLVHSIAFAPREDLHCRVVDTSRAGFAMAMDISCHSFIRMARLAEPLMSDGGCLLTMTYYGSEKVVDSYNLMGPVKAALESSVKYMAAELAEQGIRVHAVSPGPLRTRAASGLRRFDELLEKAADRAPGYSLVGIDDVGSLSTYLVSDAARALTGSIIHVDKGYNIYG